MSHKTYCELCCTKCLPDVFPSSNLDNNELYLEIEATHFPSSDTLKGMPSFTIQSLLNKLPGQNFETNEFMNETITSKYFTPAEAANCLQ